MTRTPGPKLLSRPYRVRLGCGAIGWLVERSIPSIIPIEPSRIRIAFPHPGVCTGDRLNDRCARLAMGLVTPKSLLDIVDLDLSEAACEYGRVLDCGRCTLRHVGCHGMTGITQAHDATLAPARKRG